MEAAFAEHPEAPIRSWRVLHACENVDDASHLAEMQAAGGMRPQLLSREFWSRPDGRRPLSLLNSWHDVRDWRHALNEAETLASLQIIHAHSFASAMAGVRGNLPVVYDFRSTLQELASRRSGPDAGTWLLRSLRVAEQFVFSRAGAVVVHSTAMMTIACENGAPSDNVFVIPEPPTTDASRLFSADVANENRSITASTCQSFARLYDQVYRHADRRRAQDQPRMSAPQTFAFNAH
jgi:hypothetical protein